MQQLDHNNARVVMLGLLLAAIGVSFSYRLSTVTLCEGTIMNSENLSAPSLTGSQLWLARTIWLVITGFTLWLYMVSIPAYYAFCRSICPDVICQNEQLTLRQVHTLTTLGLSLNSYALFLVILSLIFAAMYLAIALVIFVRKSDDGLALFAALMLVTFGLVTFAHQPDHFLLTHPAWWLAVATLNYIGDVTIMLFFFIFPSGHFAPRWTWALAGAWVLMEAAHIFFSGSRLDREQWPKPFADLAFQTFVGAALFAQVYRYRRVSNARQRQQTKWVVVGATGALGGLLGLGLLLFSIPTFEENIFGKFVLNIAFPAFIVLIPLSIGIAILRSRLWDIDILIRRTLIYSALTAALALVYFGSVVLLETLLRGLTNQTQNPLVTVLATLVLAALFTPLRRRVQEMIDRRFYRRKYDAEQVLAAFGETVRNETDLERLTATLVGVVQETLQPQQVALWLTPVASAQPGSSAREAKPT